MDNYKKIIDSLIEELNKEYESKHEITTKMLNYEYFTGKIYGLFDVIEKTLGIDDFMEIILYRKKERDEISAKFNLEIINPIYSIVRAK